MKKIKRRMEYDTPMVEILEARVERGFAGSIQQNPQPQGIDASRDAYEGGSTLIWN